MVSVTRRVDGFMGSWEGGALVPRTCGGDRRPTLRERRWNNRPTPIVMPAPHSARARREHGQQAPICPLRWDECTPLRDDRLLPRRSCGIARILTTLWLVPLADVAACSVDVKCQWISTWVECDNQCVLG